MIKTGITEKVFSSLHRELAKERPQMGANRSEIRTVDGNGDALVKGVAVSTNESRDLAQLVDLEVLGGDTFGWLGLNDLNVDVVGLCDSTDGRGARVTL